MVVAVRADVPGLAVSGVAAGGGVARLLRSRFRSRCCRFLLFRLFRHHRLLDVPGHAVEVVPPDPQDPARVHLLFAHGGSDERGQGVDGAKARLELLQSAFPGAQERSFFSIVLLLFRRRGSCCCCCRRRGRSRDRSFQDQVALVEDDAVGVGDLGHRLGRRLCEKLRRERGLVAFSSLLAPPEVDRLPQVPPPVDGVDESNHAIQTAAVCHLFNGGESLDYGLGVGQARRLDHDRVEGLPAFGVGDQLHEHADEVVADRAAQAAVGQSDDGLAGALEEDVSRGDERRVNVDLSELVLDDGEAR